MACINSLIGTKLSSGRQVYIRCGALSHPCTAGGIDFFFFFFFLQEEHLLKCASAELPSRHETGGGTLREDAEEEASIQTACNIKNIHLQYMS